MESVPSILFTLGPGAHRPTKGCAGDAGWDLYVSKDTNVQPGRLALVPTGVCLALPDGMWVHLLSRSSTPRKHGVTVIPAVIDNGYRGEMLIQVLSASDHEVVIPAGSRIAQIVPHLIIEPKWSCVEVLPVSERGERGFGSTGG